MKIAKKEKGLTLIELIIIIAILGILTSISIPKNKIRDYKLHSQAVALTNDIRMIRYLMMTEGGYYYIFFTNKGYTVMNGLEFIKKVELGEDIWVGNNMENVIKFSYRGRPINAGSVMIQDTVTYKLYDITIVPFTGRILMKDFL